MPAGDSAAREASRRLALAEAHPGVAAPASPTGAARVVTPATHGVAALAPLATAGYHLLTDLRSASVLRPPFDLVVVGPAGVFVVGAKVWDDVTIDGDRVHRGGVDVTDELMTLADHAYRAEGELAEVGLAPGEVHPVAVLAGRSGLAQRVGPVIVVGEGDVLRQIVRRGTRLGPAQLDVVAARCRAWLGHEDAAQDADDVPDDAPDARPDAPAGDAAPAVAPHDDVPAVAPHDDAPQGPPDSVAPAAPLVPSPRGPVVLADAAGTPLLTEAEVQQIMLEGLMAAPIEEWMAFLDPAQARLVRRSFNGPSRIRGPVGTGKTVVALHRAAYLARMRQGTVLVTTYIPTLPDVLRQHLARLAPNVVDRVEFAGVHEAAKRILEERGVEYRIDAKQIASAWTAAWGRVAGGSVIDTDTHEQDYWHDEVSYVIKGRGLTAWEQYATLPRLGRRHRLGVPERRVVWDLYVEYQRELHERGVHDFADQIALAEAELRREPPTATYTAVVVDEAQDLTCMMIRMLHALVGDAPDGLTLVGDGQQAIYPGGYTLAEAGVSVAGRSSVLDVNHRSTREILQFASVLVQDDEVVDLEGGIVRGELPGEVARHGHKPLYVRCANEDDRQRRMVQRIHEVVAEIGTNFGDVGVLSVSRRGVDLALEALRRAGVPAVNLEQFDGVPVNRVKVGTIKRAKGLEFKQVLVVDIDASWITERTEGMDDVERERRDLRRRELYVAMTRARDGLWVASV